MAELEDIRVELPHGRSLTMQELIHGWERHVSRLAAEMPGPTTDESWGAHDYFAALNLRDLIESARSELDDDQDLLVDFRVTIADEALRAMTDEDHEGLVTRFGQRDPRSVSRWWWHRVPRKGLVRAELDEWSGTDGGH